MKQDPELDDEDGLRRLIEYARREASDQRHDVAAFFLDLAARSLTKDEAGNAVAGRPVQWVG